MSPLHSLHATRLDGSDQDFADYRDKLLLIVNVASRCGYTPQYRGLEALWRNYGERGLMVLGFPCNQFAGQEPASEAEIGAFCSTTYEVSFPMFAKVDVNGAGTHPVFQFLKSAAPGLLGTEGVKWNFTKFLVSRDGSTVTRYAPAVEPAFLAADIERQL